MSKEQSLVDYLVDVSRFSIKPLDTSMARRMIVEGEVKVNGEVVTDPAFRLPFDEGFFIETPDEKIKDETPIAQNAPGLVRYDSPDQIFN